MSARAARLLPLLALLASACGGASALPEARPCAVPTATPTVARNTNAGFQYLTTLRDGTGRLKNLTSDFRERWPDGRFYRQDNFRPEFAEYAGGSACITAALRALLVPPGVNQLPSTRILEVKNRVDPLLLAFDAAFRDGTEAVRTRNVTDYRSFNRRLDELTIQLDEAITLPPIPRSN